MSTSKPGRSPHSSGWVIVTVKRPLLWTRGDKETWNLNPGRRYILNENQIETFSKDVDTVSDLKTSEHYRQLNCFEPIAGKRILIERYRERGLGDLMFFTGPMAWLQHHSNHQAKIHFYALNARGAVFQGNPALEHKCAFVGPMEYDALVNYDFHWFSEVVTEYSEEQDQLNCYDAIFKQLGVDYRAIDPRFKRPHLYLLDKAIPALFFYLEQQGAANLNATPYYVVAPLSNSGLRTASYQMWLDLIRELSQEAPVIVMGSVNPIMPQAGMTFEEFQAQLDAFEGPNVINLISNEIPIRTLMALVAKSRCFFGLDSGPLFFAQAFRVPAITLWGTHDPRVRIGYDPDYMELAIFNKGKCAAAPCYAYSGWPVHKCPQGENQRVCEVLGSVSVNQILEKLEFAKEKHFAMKPLRPI